MPTSYKSEGATGIKKPATPSHLYIYSFGIRLFNHLAKSRQLNNAPDSSISALTLVGALVAPAHIPIQATLDQLVDPVAERLNLDGLHHLV